MGKTTTKVYNHQVCQSSYIDLKAFAIYHIIYIQTSFNAISICDRAGKKPSAVAAQELKKLFASSTSVTVPKKRPAFDPTNECVFAAEKKKKKAARNRGTLVNFVLVSDPDKGLPRGQARKELLGGGMSKKIEIFRHTKPVEVYNKVLQQFPSISAYSYIQVVDGSHLTVSNIQHLDADEVIKDSQKRNGNILYITPSEVCALYISQIAGCLVVHTYMYYVCMYVYEKAYLWCVSSCVVF